MRVRQDRHEMTSEEHFPSDITHRSQRAITHTPHRNIDGDGEEKGHTACACSSTYHYLLFLKRAGSGREKKIHESTIGLLGACVLRQ